MSRLDLRLLEAVGLVSQRRINFRLGHRAASPGMESAGGGRFGAEEQ